MPVGGTVVEVNDTINESAESVNQDPYGAGWMIKIKIGNPDEVDKLMSAAEYEEFISSE
jgi:glycine cleavage system H protein